MTIERKIRVRVNGVTYERTVEARRLLADFLRDELGLTGTHLGCEHGVCGACTIVVNGEAVRSCLLFALQARSEPLHDAAQTATAGLITLIPEGLVLLMSVSPRMVSLACPPVRPPGPATRAFATRS